MDRPSLVGGCRGATTDGVKESIDRLTLKGQKLTWTVVYTIHEVMKLILKLIECSNISS